MANAIFGIFKPHEYGKVILPMTVIKRFHDCLTATHAEVLAAHEKHANLTPGALDMMLMRASGYKFYNTSKVIFEHAAMDCYVKSMEGFEDLMQEDHKRNKLREKLAQELYRQFRSQYANTEDDVLMAAEDELQ